jgi:hypothetical protein
MTLVWPDTGFENDVAVVDGFKALLCDGYENPDGLTGRVRFILPERPTLGFSARFGESLELAASDPSQTCDTEVWLPLATLHRIFREVDRLDWRDPEVIGTISFSGDLTLANHLSKCCVRPSELTRARFRRAERLHARSGYRALRDVKALHCPTQRQILTAIDEGRPVVITGFGGVQEWTLDRLVERFGDAIVRVRSATERQTMATFVAELKAFEAAPDSAMIDGFVKPYTDGAALPEVMAAEFGPMFFGRSDYIPPQLWLGSVPTRIPTSSLHRDPLSGFLMQVIGRKRLDLYSADQAELLYPMKSYNLYQPCWFKPEAPDYARYPLAQKAQGLSITLNPGEILLQPAGWFHQVHALDSPNMSVSYFWRY